MLDRSFFFSGGAFSRHTGKLGKILGRFDPDGPDWFLRNRSMLLGVAKFVMRSIRWVQWQGW